MANREVVPQGDRGVAMVGTSIEVGGGLGADFSSVENCGTGCMI